MSRNLKLLIIISLIFITGCSTKYDLTIDSDLNLKETVTLYENNKTLEVYNNNLKLVPDQKFSQYKEMSTFKNYKLIKKIFEKDKTGGVIQTKFSSLEKYRDSFVLTTIFEDIQFLEYGNIVNIQTSGYNPSIFVSEEDFEFFMEDIEVNIKFHNDVVENNAQKYDEKTNTYTWILNQDSKSGNIMFSIDKSKKRYDIIIKDFINDNLFSIIGIGTLLTITLLITIVMYRKNKNSISI
ncbi:MAG: hypothetical protein E7166_05015 [Firmicutes bacterium]|nr:hypothetical protein [Bacillota bacterium]